MRGNSLGCPNGLHVDVQHALRSRPIADGIVSADPDHRTTGRLPIPDRQVTGPRTTASKDAAHAESRRSVGRHAHPIPRSRLRVAVGNHGDQGRPPDFIARSLASVSQGTFSRSRRASTVRRVVVTSLRS